MTSRLLNVRLDEDRVRKARRLRESGVAVSDVVREAIDARFEALDRPETARDVRRALEHIFEQYPDPAGQPRRSYDVHDRRASARAIRRRLKRRGR